MLLFSPSPQTALELDNIDSKIDPWLGRLVYPLGRFLVLPAYFGTIAVRGRDRLPSDGPIVLAPTHRSRWDPILVAYATGRHVTGRDLRYMVTANEVKGVQGWFIRRLGGFPIDTENPGIASLRHGIELLHDRQMLVIFPEGNIFRDGQLHRLKPGLTRLAVQAEASQADLGVQIVPISLHYSDPFPSWGCDVEIRIGDPLRVAEYVGAGNKRGAEQLRSHLQSALEALDRGDPSALEAQAA